MRKTVNQDDTSEYERRNASRDKKMLTDSDVKNGAMSHLPQTVLRELNKNVNFFPQEIPRTFRRP